MFANALFFAGLASMASAHMIMNTPKPYGTPNSSPLKPDGSDFPCKGVGYQGDFSANSFEQGGKGKLAFTGSAVHGGGSCQVSVTTDLEPSKGSAWKVIHSIEGGCPAKGVGGNLPEDPSGSGAGTYEFPIPKELPAGKYSIAWTWFNKVGNREMYMNCAPMTVTGSGVSKDYINGLPDMFTANIGNGCTTADSADLKFPNPGKSVEKNDGKFMPPNGCSGGGSGGGSGGSSPAPEQPKTEQPKTEQPATEQPKAPSAPVMPQQPSTGGGSGGGKSGACSTEGTWNCIDGKSYQRCASGQWSVAQPTTGSGCVVGEGAELKMNAKRSEQRMRRVVRSA